MAVLAGQQEINRTSSRVSNVSSKSASSNKSFSSWSSRKPRDSLEKMRQRQRMMEATQAAPMHHRLLMSVRNFSVQVLGEEKEENNEEEEEEDEEEQESDAYTSRCWEVCHPISHNIFCKRYPKGKASLLVFILNVIVSYAFGAAITGILDIFHTKKNQDISAGEEHVFQLIQLLFRFCFSRMFYPLAGFIADVYIGRCRMIHIAFLLLFGGYVILVITYILEVQSSFNTSDLEMLLNAIRGLSFLFISAGGGAFEATIIPFGVDQLQGASSAEISSYFHFFYFSRNLGMGFGMVTYSMVSYLALKVSESDGLTDEEVQLLKELYSVLQPLVTLSILTIGLVLNVCLYHWYFKNTLWENPVKLVAKVLCYAATVKRHLPVHRRAFRYGEEKKKRIDLAKVEYDGIFSSEKVEDVKSFCRICLLMFTLIPTMISVNAVYNITSNEVNATLAKLYKGKFLEIDFYPNVFTVVNCMFIFVSLPIINFCVIPSFPKLTIRTRIGVGLTLYLVGMITTVVIHAVGLQQKVQLWCHLLPVAIFSFAEVFTIVSVLEFIYVQSPESMKGLMTGLFFFIFGISSVVSSVAYYEYSDSLENKKLLLFHIAFTVIQVLGLVFYGIAAALHRNRLRPDEDSFSSNQQLMIEDQLNPAPLA